MSEITGLKLTTSVASRERRLDALLAGGDPNAPDLTAALIDAQILGSAELAGISVSWDEVQASRRGEAAPPEIAALRQAWDVVAAGESLDRAALGRWHVALFGGEARFRSADASRSFDPPPAPGESVEGRLKILEEWLNGESGRQLAAPQIGALAMARLVEIQPFERGNGRVARLAASHVMTRAGARPPILVGGDRPRLEQALQAAFRFETEALTKLLEEASERCLDVLIEAVRAGGLMAELALELPPGAVRLFETLAAAGARPYLVGGSVRDAYLRRSLGDLDIEVFGMPPAALQQHLAALGRVDPVGQAFTVFKLSGLEGVAGNVDVAIPRRDSKVGPGHRGIAVTGDPDLSVEEASRRRDFTINAMLLDPLGGEWLDPHGGRADLDAQRLRCVDPATFSEDPLRALRAVQLAARFELAVEEQTAALCASMPLSELPPERIFGELEKLLLQAARPSIGLALLSAWGLLPSIAPELVPLATTEQEPDWHPEGDVWTHTLLAIDEAAALIADLDRPRALAVMLGTLCHDLGKPATTRFEEGRIRSRGHEEAGVPPTLSLLDRLRVFTLLGYDLRDQVVALVRHHLKPGQLYAERERVSDGAIRRLARKCEPRLLYRVARADCLGRAPGVFPPVAMEWFLERALALEVTERPPEPLLRGRDVLALGVSPGPLVGRVLHELYERQLDGEFAGVDEARAAAARIVSSVGESAG